MLSILQLRFSSYVRNEHKSLECLKCSTPTCLDEDHHQDSKCFDSKDVCAYVQYLHGIHQDDWNLEWIKNFQSFNQDAQKFVYYCTLLYPDQSPNENLAKLGKSIGYSLKVYLSIIVMESKLQSQLLYFLRAVMKHLS